MVVCDTLIKEKISLFKKRVIHRMHDTSHVMTDSEEKSLKYCRSMDQFEKAFPKSSLKE